MNDTEKKLKKIVEDIKDGNINSKTVQNNKKIKEYFDLEVKFNVMIADVNKIIGEAIQDVMN